MNSTHRTPAMALLCIAILCGCGKDDSKKSAGSPSGAAGSSGVVPGGASGDAAKAKSGIESAMGSAHESAQKAAETIRQELAKQLDDQESKIDELKTKAASVADPKLKGLLDAIDAKLDQARAKLDELRNSSGSPDATRNELTRLVADVKTLYDQATQRLHEVGK
jgi:septal ring factor EnvC (AmiA/AmiB activator)